MTTTHDLPTVSGWWRGRDLEWRHRLGLMGDEAHENADRRRDRDLLWQAFRASGAAAREQPAEWDADPVVDAAAAHIGSAACDLALLPVEDALGLTEQPNVPGTLHEHPNWQRRLGPDAAVLLDEPGVAARLQSLDVARKAARSSR